MKTMYARLKPTVKNLIDTDSSVNTEGLVNHLQQVYTFGDIKVSAGIKILSYAKVEVFNNYIINLQAQFTDGK